MVAHTSDIEYAEVMDWDSDMQAIHYWRPFEDGPSMKTFGRNLTGECCKIYLKDPAGSRLQATGGTCHDALCETMRVRWRWGTRDSGVYKDWGRNSGPGSTLTNKDHEQNHNPVS